MTAIVVTLNRADCVVRCLDALAVQDSAVDQVVVVDASTDPVHRRRTLEAVERYAGPGEATCVRNEAGYGHMTQSRNLGLERATGEVIAFLDDDAFARPRWSAALLDTYRRRPDLGGMGGRAVRHERQLSEPVNPRQTRIGVLRRDGMIGGAWTVDCGRELDVEHLQGCNMSFRRSVLAELGGLRDEYPGPEVREETDLCLRVRRLGYPLVYNPRAVVVHIGAPKPEGSRFDFGYEYFARRNHVYLLIRNFGLGPLLWRYLLSSAAMDLRLYAGQVRRSRGRSRGRSLPASAWGLVTTQRGKLVGLAVGAIKRWRCGLDPVRRDAIGQRLARRLAPASGDAAGHAAAQEPRLPIDRDADAPPQHPETTAEEPARAVG